MKGFYMNDKTITLNALLAITFLMIPMYISGMEKKIGLLDLSCDGSSLAEIVKATVMLSATCKRNQKEMPIVFGKFCKDRYDITEKNNVMKKLLWSMNDETYWYKRRAAFILVCAGADNTADEFYPLLRRAIHRTDKEMIAALFENDADPNQEEHQEPDWFAIKDVDMLNMFIARDVNLHVEAFGCPNVLWWTLVHNPLSEWIELYLKYKVDAKKRKTRTGNCILHQLVHCAESLSIKSIDDYVRIGELLLNAAPELINMENKDGDTSLGAARKQLTDRYTSDNGKQTIIALINLFEKHVGKTAQQLT
jgi:hypothetical protein